MMTVYFPDTRDGRRALWHEVAQGWRHRRYIIRLMIFPAMGRDDDRPSGIEVRIEALQTRRGRR